MLDSCVFILAITYNPQVNILPYTWFKGKWSVAQCTLYMFYIRVYRRASSMNVVLMVFFSESGVEESEVRRNTV